jgi:DNA-binding CsgD family transcriptional regulator
VSVLDHVQARRGAGLVQRWCGENRSEDPITKPQVRRVEVLGSYSNPSLISRIGIILASQTHHHASDRLSIISRNPARQAQVRLSADEIAELVAAYEAGATQQELATQFQIHRGTVAAHLDRAGITNRRGAMTPEQVTDAIDLYTQGWSLASIGNHFGLYPTSIYYWLKKEGLLLRPRAGWKWSETEPQKRPIARVAVTVVRALVLRCC